MHGYWINIKTYDHLWNKCNSNDTQIDNVLFLLAIIGFYLNRNFSINTCILGNYILWAIQSNTMQIQTILYDVNNKITDTYFVNELKVRIKYVWCKTDSILNLLYVLKNWWGDPNWTHIHIFCTVLFWKDNSVTGRCDNVNLCFSFFFFFSYESHYLP